MAALNEQVYHISFHQDSESVEKKEWKDFKGQK